MNTSPSSKSGPRLTGRPVGATLWSLSWPTVIGLFSILAFNLIDTLYIGRLGSAQLAAIGFCFPVIFSLGSVGFGIASGATAVISQAIGAGNKAEMRAIASNSLILSMLAMSTMSLVGLLTIDPVFRLLGASDNVLIYINAYMKIYYYGLPLIMAPVILNGFMRATGDTLLPAAVMIGGALMNGIVSPILVFGLLGAPTFGIAGAAFGTIAARGTMTVVSVILIHIRERLFLFNKATLAKFSVSVTGVLAIGIPAILTQVITPFSNAALTRLLAGYGQETVAAFAVGARLEALFLIAFWALQGGVAPFIGQNYGAGRHDRLIEAQAWIIRFTIGWALFVFCVALFFGKTLSSAFTNDTIIAAMSAQYFLYVTAGFMGAGLMLASTAVFNSLKRPILATGVVALRFIGLYIPFGLLFAQSYGPQGVFAAAGISYLIAGVVAILIMHRLLKTLKPYNAKIADEAGPPILETPVALPHINHAPHPHPLAPEDDQSQNPTVK